MAQRQNGSKIDTSKYIDYSIVNPSKLPIDLQFDICQRCHLQGNTVLKEGRSFFDFKPGMKLSDYMTIFLPKYKNADDEFIMASHSDRLKQSPCFIESYKKATSTTSTSSVVGVAGKLKPYKDAMTCVTCHNPHVSVRETNPNVFNDACNNCHKPAGRSNLECTDKNVVAARNAKPGHTPSKFLNCVACHMPSSGSTDIPHVTVHDHYIRKPVTKKDKDKVKEFIGLYAINEKNPSNATKAWAYINQYDKFDANPDFLDSAERYLWDRSKEDLKQNIHALVQLKFSKQNYVRIGKYVNQVGETELFNMLNTKSYDNKDAWCAYQIAEALANSEEPQRSVKWFEKAVDLAPYNLGFRSKLGSIYMSSGRIADAEREIEFILKEHPKNVSAYTNLGYIKLKLDKIEEAERLYKKGLELDADYEPLLLNFAGLKAYKKDYKGAIEVIKHLLKRNPDHPKAKAILVQLKNAV